MKSYGSKNIADFQNGDITVHVYTHKPGQVPGRSLYKPTYDFVINQSQSSTNNNAAYWHVFNIEAPGKTTDGAKASIPGISDRIMTKQESIETSICQIKKNIYLDFVCE